MPEIPENWPNWLTLILATLYILRGALIKFLPGALQKLIENASARRADQVERSQEIEEIQLNARLQTTASEQLRSSWREEQLIETIQSQQSFVQDVLTQEIRAQSEVISSLRNEIRSLRRAVLRVGDITAAVFSTLQDKNGKHLFKMSGEIDNLINGLSNDE